MTIVGRMRVPGRESARDSRDNLRHTIDIFPRAPELNIMRSMRRAG
jgi:hypothetical protein